MTRENTRSRFKARLRRPKQSADGDDAWAFIVLPPEASAKMPRRGRTSVEGTVNGTKFKAMLEPDGQKSHWLRIDEDLLEAMGAAFGDDVDFEIMPARQEFEPEIPADFLDALTASPASRHTWDDTTTIARIDWIHWISSARQAKTRSKRIRDACDMLASGKKRVCCFDPSGFYSKAFSAPQADDQV
jgi:hypothetical protein